MKVYLQKNVLDDEEVKRIEAACPYLTITQHPETDIEAAFVWPNFVSEERLVLHPYLRWIQVLSAGFDKVDFVAANKRNIKLTNARHVNSIPIAEDVVSRILYFNRNMGFYAEKQKHQVWEPKQNAKEIYRATVGILGAGSIAVEIAKRLKAFDATVICYRHHENSHPLFDETYYGKPGLKTFLSQSDYVIVSMPLNPETHHLVNAETLAWMKKDALLINIARGDIIDEKALIECLQTQRIRGASLDVFHQEPLDPNSPLWHLDNVYLTPHISFASERFQRRLSDLLIENTERYFAEESLINRIN